MKIYKYFLLHNKKLKPWIKHWLYINSKDKNYVLSDILQGTSFYLENSSSKNFNLFQISGNSIQNGTPTPSNQVPINSAGDNINLLENTYIASGTQGGITHAKNTDGTMLLNGTSTTKVFMILNTFNLAAGTYILSGCPNGGSEDGYRQDILVGNNVIAKDFGSGGSFTLNETTSIQARIRIGSGTVINNLTFKPMIAKGSIATPYSPYGMGNINEVISNKNLFKIPTTTINGITCTQLEDGAYCFNGTATADSFFKFALTKEIANGTNHVLSCTSNQTSSKVHIRTRNSSNGLSDTMVMNVTSSSITSTKQCSYSEITIQKGAELSNFIVYPQLELGSSATSFVPHQEQNISIPCQQPMRSIGDIRDVFVKQDGVWYEKHNIGVIESYNGETITTDYMSTTGSLSTGAFVQYVLNEPNYIECTQEQTEALESIIRAYTYEPITFINSTDTTPAFLKIRYYMEV